MRRTLAITAWLMLGHAVAGALFWALLHVPESNVPMVGLSAVLALLTITVVALVETIALAAWTREATVGGRRLRAALPALVAALVPFALLYWLTGLAQAWLSAHRGEVDAWLMLRVRMLDTTWLHAAAAWGLWFVRYPLGVSLALGVFGAFLQVGAGGHKKLGWLTAALRPRRLALITLWLLVLVWLPWQALHWRPPSLPPSWLEAAFVAGKLLILYAAAHLGWALVLRTGAPWDRSDARGLSTSPRST